jgi:CRP-like cAMP-binding protein
VSVLDEQPQLAARLDPESLGVARRHALAAVLTIPPGPWRGARESWDGEGNLGLLVLDGFLLHDVVLVDRFGSELVGPGDLLRPGGHEGESAPVPFAVAWRVLESTRLAVLDRRFAMAIGRWPEITAELLNRSVARSEWLALRLAVAQLGRVDVRLLVLLWHLADRWGHVERDGVVVPLRLTHQLLARLAGAQRPSVTIALGDLRARGLVERRSDRTWLLHGDPPEEFDRLYRRRGGRRRGGGAD